MPDRSDVFDVAVIGAGAAGITIARALSANGRQVALIEGGGLEQSGASQQLYEGTSTGEEYPIGASRLRFFGGTTNHWTGLCRPLSEMTFTPRPDIGYPGWPIAHTDVQQYLPQAMDILDLDAESGWLPATDTTAYRKLLETEFEEVIFKWSAPTRFKEKYLVDVQNDPNITLSVNESFVDVLFDAEGHITLVKLKNIETMTERDVEAKAFVLACGGIENARLLLHINQQNSVEFGNTGNWLGASFMEHPHVYNFGHLVITDPDYDFPGEVQSLALRPDVTGQEQILGNTIRLTRTNDELGLRRELDEMTTLERGEIPWRVVRLDLVIEQEPTRESRITLSGSDRDTLSIPRVELNWTLSDRDFDTMKVAALKFTQMVVKAGIGRAKVNGWVTTGVNPTRRAYGWHHVGTTRMASSPEDGVVDVNCRLFGTQNFFIAGSSVFPTGGYANPTLSIVQMSLRLADHLHSNFLAE